MVTGWYPCIIPSAVTSYIKRGWRRFYLDRDGYIVATEYHEGAY